MRTLDISPLDAAKDAAEAKSAQVEEAQQTLARLRAQRERAAVAESNTRQVRSAIVDAEANLEDLRMQASRLAEALAEEEASERRRSQHAAIAEVYRRDVEYLMAIKLISERQAELDRAREECAHLTSRDWYSPQLDGRGHPNPDLHSSRDSAAAVDLAPLRTTEPSRGQGHAPIENDIDFDIARLERLAAEAEKQASHEPDSVGQPHRNGESK
jgi:DNA repair exonuclease SbcCD ATPase subunit